MNPERWRRVEVLFDQAVERPEAERAGFLDEACAGDRELLGEVKALLASAPTARDSLRKLVIAEVRMLASEAVTAQVGRRIGRFRLVDLLGEGGMGAVYLAERDDAQFSHRVAIKILRHAAGSPETVARFRDERQILAALEHPNIVRLFDGGSTDDGLPYLVMEHVEGTTITRYAAQHELSVRARVELVRRVCSALQCAHQNLVVHRDIKPSNILVDADGAPKILDFGIAKLLAPVDRFEREARTRTGFAMFTPEYASPEQARGDVVSTATDVYSAGAVLYELVTGRSPHRAADSKLDMLRVICEVEPPRPSTIGLDGTRRELMGDLDNIILKALHKEPARRYASMEQLSDDLGRWLDGLPVAARTATMGYRARKFVGRNKGVVAATTLIAATLLGATVVSLRQARRADEQAARAGVERANAEAERANAEIERTRALDAARLAQIETNRARDAEARLQKQYDALKAEQERRTRAEADARAKGKEAELRRTEAEIALSSARRDQQLAENASLQAREAKARALQAAQAEKAAREEAEVLHRQELERLKRRQEASAKITDTLR